MKPFFVITLIFTCLTLSGCEKEIRFRQSFEPTVVVNSLLNPDSLLTVDLWWSMNIDDGNAFRRIENAAVSISENGTIILKAVSTNDPVHFDYKPKENKEYSIKVTVDGHPDITASTFVPAKPDGKCVFNKRVQVPESVRAFNHYDIEMIEADKEISALYLNVNSYYDPKYNLDYDYGVYQASIYTSSLYTDTFNRTIFPDDAIYTGSPDEYYQFIRIPEQNVEEAFPLIFSVFGRGKITMVDLDDYTNKWDVYGTDDVIVTAAGYDYDNYFKAVFIHWDTATNMNPFIFEIYHIPSNIENGLGIFAGYSQRLFKFDFNLIEP